MDPAAWLVMLRSHQAQLQQDQAQQLAIAHAHLPVGKDHQDAEGQNHDRQASLSWTPVCATDGA